MKRWLFIVSIMIAIVAEAFVIHALFMTNKNSINETTPTETTLAIAQQIITQPTGHKMDPKPIPFVPEQTTEPQPTTYTLTFVGDCTFGTMPSWMSYGCSFISVVQDDYLHPFDNVRTYFENDDCTFINLEGVLANNGTPEDKKFTFRGPTKYINIMTSSSVEVANLSNNHTFDFGAEGYKSTVNTLKENQICYIEKNRTALYTTQSGLTIGMYGVYFMIDEKDAQSDINELKEAGADIIVAAVHWGIEREYTPNNTQKYIAHKLIDFGVDIVWGHHPHVLQPIEQYKNGTIYYSLGNFSFGGNHNPSDKDTVVIQQTITENEDGAFRVDGFIAIPCRLSSKESYNDFQPTPYTTEDMGYHRTLSRLGLSTSINGTSGGAHGASDSLPDGTPTDTHEPQNPAQKSTETLADKN